MSFMIGQKFPQHVTPAVMENGETDNDFSVATWGEGNYTVVFFYPLDFTFVCPTEIVAFDKAMDEFKARGVKVVAASVDSTHCHAAWRRTSLNQGGIGEVSFPILSDMERKLSSELGIVAEGGVTYRASYLMDKNGVVRHMVINDLPIGRSVQEMLRIIDALQFHEEHGDVCPANWQKGEQAMKPTTESTGSYLSSVA